MSSDAFYLELLAEVNPIIEEFGTAYVVQTPGAFDDTTLTTAPPTERPIIGLVADSKTLNGFGIGGSDSSFTWTATKNLLMQASAAPQPNEKVVVDGREFSFTNVQEIKPANIVLLYILDISL